MRHAAAVLVGGLALAGAAAAHTPYLKPTTFAPDRDVVTVEAALTEGNFFVPDIPIRGEGGFWATGETGAPVKVDAVTTLKEFVAVEVPLTAQGTWRISTGERPGRAAKWAKIDGTWKMVRPAGAPPGGGGRGVDEASVPAGAETMTSQSFLRAETYVTRGAPTRGALKPTGQGLELEPVTHPNEIFVDDAFKFRLLDAGKPVQGVEFNVSRAGDAYAEKRYAYAAKTDAKGEAAVTFDQPGAYVLQTRYPVRPEGSTDPLPRSATYTLTFEVTR
jgi:hypothetical protein